MFRNTIPFSPCMHPSTTFDPAFSYIICLVSELNLHPRPLDLVLILLALWNLTILYDFDFSWSYSFSVSHLRGAQPNGCQCPNKAVFSFPLTSQKGEFHTLFLSLTTKFRLLLPLPSSS